MNENINANSNIKLTKNINKFLNSSYGKIDYCIWIVIGVCCFLAIYGVLPLKVTYDHWIFNGYVESDVTQHYAGWLAYRNSKWTFPLGQVVGVGNPTITYTDSIPFVAILFKALSPILPQTFQYFGIYIMLCFILQGVSSGMLLSLFCDNKLLNYMGVIIFCCSPIMIERAFRHTALASHWLILFMLYYYFKSRRDKEMNVRCAIFPVLAIGIHPYFLPVLFGLMFANMIELFIIKRKTIIRSLILLGISLMATVIVGFVIGALGTSSKLEGDGYGYFSMNLNAIINPISCSGIQWSRFIKTFPQILGNYDGFNYLGVGIIVLNIVAVSAIMNKQLKWKKFLKRNAVLLIICVAFTLFAISNIITFNDHIVMNIPFPKNVLSVAAIFRASSRMFYPVYYLIILFGIVIISYCMKKYGKLLIVLSCLIIQLIDIFPAMRIKRESFCKVNVETSYEKATITGSDIWQEISEKCSQIKLLNWISDYKLAAFAEKNNIDINIAIASSHFEGNEDYESAYSENIMEIRENKLCEDAVYVTNDEQLAYELQFENQNIIVYKEDPYYILASEKNDLHGEKWKKSDMQGIRVSELSDENWDLGVSKFDCNRVLLLEYSDLLLSVLNKTDSLHVNGIKRTIEKIDVASGWIKVSVNGNALEFAYPNFIELERKEVQE